MLDQFPIPHSNVTSNPQYLTQKESNLKYLAFNLFIHIASQGIMDYLSEAVENGEETSFVTRGGVAAVLILGNLLLS